MFVVWEGVSNGNKNLMLSEAVTHENATYSTSSAKVEEPVCELSGERIAV